jgi:propionyl-CoA carboxylase alpha chain
VLAWQPAADIDARFDSGIETGSRVGIDFDPMLAKVIVHAPTRGEAAGRLARALETTRVHGITTNRDFLVATLRSPEFLAGETTTDFIERVQPQRRRTPSREELEEAGVIAALAAQHGRHEQARFLPGIRSGWRSTVMPPEEVVYESGGDEILIEYRSRRDGTFWVRAGENEHNAEVHSCGNGAIDLAIDGRRLAATVTIDGNRHLIHGPTGQVDLVERPRFPVRGVEAVAGGLVAPMPGKVISTHIEAGDEVEVGQLLIVLEAMKMEHRVTAPEAGIVTDLRVAEGDQVDNGVLLVVISSAAEEKEETS